MWQVLSLFFKSEVTVLSMKSNKMYLKQNDVHVCTWQTRIASARSILLLYHLLYLFHLCLIRNFGRKIWDNYDVRRQMSEWLTYAISNPDFIIMGISVVII